MIDLKTIKRTKEGGAIKALIYGEPGVGKSTFANTAPNPLFISAEGGLNHIECTKISVKNWNEVKEALVALKEQEHQFETIILDPIGWVLDMFEEDLLEGSGVDNINKLGGGYGAFKGIMQSKLKAFLSYLDSIHDLGINIVFLAHEKIRKVPNTAGEDFLQSYPKCQHDFLMEQIAEWIENRLYIKWRGLQRTTEDGFKNRKTKAIGVAERILCANGSDQSHFAGNKLNLRDEMPLGSWGEVFGGGKDE